MRVPVKAIGEETIFIVDAQPTDTVVNFKQKIREKLRGVLPTDNITLIYGGESLPDHRILSDVGIDGRYYVGVEVTTKDGRNATIAFAAPSQSLGPDNLIPAVPAPGTSLSMNIAQNPQLQVLEREPALMDDIFETFRYLTSKYYRCSGRVSPADEDRRYSSTWSMTGRDLINVDILSEMGFRRSMIVQAYIACEKNITAAVDLLLREEE